MKPDMLCRWTANTFNFLFHPKRVLGVNSAVTAAAFTTLEQRLKCLLLTLSVLLTAVSLVKTAHETISEWRTKRRNKRKKHETESPELPDLD